MNAKIFGVGLPRTGTASLAAALQNAGIQVKHYCQIHDMHSDDDSDNDLSAIIDNSSYKKYYSIIKNNADSLFILTTRDAYDWLTSISRYANKVDNIPNIKVYEKKIHSLIQELNLQKQLLVLNIFNNNSCEDLYKFLGYKYNGETFPHIKRQGAKWTVI